LSLQVFLRESTWGYPIISAIHVLGMAWFGGTILIGEWVPELRRLRHIGLALVLISGVMLFWMQPAQYERNIPFYAKMLMLVALTRVKSASALSFVLWMAIIVASRGIAFG
jgi:hypothetical protein